MEKLRYWISGATTSGDSKMPCNTNISRKVCCDSDANDEDNFLRYHCLGCGRFLCGNCARESGSGAVLGSEKEVTRVSIKGCKFCAEISARTDSQKKNREKVYPRDSPEPPSPCFSGSEKTDHSMTVESIHRDCLSRYLEPEEHAFSPCASSVTDFSAQPSPVSARCSPNRSV